MGDVGPYILITVVGLTEGWDSMHCNSSQRNHLRDDHQELFKPGRSMHKSGWLKSAQSGT